MPWDRKQRQEAILREKIAVIVLERLSDPRLGFITITRVELSKDKKIAKVFYTVLGTDSQVRSTTRALADGRGRVQELLAPTLNMRSMPELRFIVDEQVKKESKLLDLIGEVTAERLERAGPDEELAEDPGPGGPEGGELEALDIAEQEDDGFPSAAEQDPPDEARDPRGDPAP